MPNELFNGVEFLERNLSTKKTPMFIKNKVKRIIWNRLLGIYMFVRGDLDFSEMANDMLPSRFHRQNIGEKKLEKLRIHVSEVFKRNGIYNIGKIKLFSNEFFPAHEFSVFESWFHTFIMIFQSITVDQYHAKEFLKKDSVVIDAGANIGVFSVFAANMCPEGKVFVFEPSKKTYDILLQNIKNYPNIRSMNIALGDKQGSGKLILAESSGSNTLEDSEMYKNSEGARKEDIEVTTIDDFVKQRGINRVDFIKMDTEGYEKKILKGAAETIKKYSPVLSLSAYHHAEDKKMIPEYILSLNRNYKCKLSRNTEDNLLFWV